MCNPYQYYRQKGVQFMLKADRKGWDIDRARRAWAYLEWRKERHLDGFCEHFGPLADAQLIAEGRPRKAYRPVMERP